MDKHPKNVNLPLLGNYSSRKEWEDVCWRKILESRGLLELLVTSNERHKLVMRAAVMEGVHRGKSYKQIADELWLSPQTISSAKRAIKENSYRSYWERSKKERKKRKYNEIFPVSSKSKHRGRRLHTKYGTINMPY